MRRETDLLDEPLDCVTHVRFLGDRRRAGPLVGVSVIVWLVFREVHVVGQVAEKAQRGARKALRAELLVECTEDGADGDGGFVAAGVKGLAAWDVSNILVRAGW